jgi:purine-nucleoside phosphorylase
MILSGRPSDCFAPCASYSLLKANALSILTVSDNLCTGGKATSEERESSFTDMVEIALDSVCR